MCFKRGLAGLFTENGTWFYRLYERDTDNGKNMRRAVDRLFRMDQEKREEIYEAVKHDMEFMDKRPGKRKIQPGK